jgi:2-oxoglutarate ferredoxin oxidoreductase subunit beta
MSYIKKPRIMHPQLKPNRLGLSIQDYEGAMSTLCAGCGHDSVSTAIVQAFFELDIEPHRVAKLSGIGCSSKTPTYFLRGAHGFNSVHGRMPSIATGANAANRDLHYIGVSGDGDSLSIGLGQMCHAIRRNVNMLYIIENNGVYGLTKGQFSASADVGSTAKKGEVNHFQPIDPVLTAIDLGGSFVARGFSGDKANLVPIIKAGIMHRGFALLDVISPCVTFNDHEGSTKSYLYTREAERTAVYADFVPEREEITTKLEQGVTSVTLHDGGQVHLRKVDDNYDPTDRNRAATYVRQHQEMGEIVTGLLYINDGIPDLHESSDTVEKPLVDLDFKTLNPGSKILDNIQKGWS